MPSRLFSTASAFRRQCTHADVANWTVRVILDIRFLGGLENGETKCDRTDEDNCFAFGTPGVSTVVVRVFVHHARSAGAPARDNSRKPQTGRRPLSSPQSKPACKDHLG